MAAIVKKEDGSAIKVGDARFVELRDATKAVLADVFTARGALTEAEEAAKAAADAKRDAASEFGNRRIAAMVALGDKVKLLSNGQGLKSATVTAIVDDILPKPGKDAPNAGTIAKDRSLIKLTVEGAIAARHAHTIAVALKARPENEKVRLWDLFATTLRIARDVHKAGKPFEAVTPDYAANKIAADRAERAAAREAEAASKGEGAADVMADDPLSLMRAAEVAATKRGLDVSSIAAAIAAIAAMMPLDDGKPEGEGADTAKGGEAGNAAPEITDDLAGGLMKSMLD